MRILFRFVMAAIFFTIFVKVATMVFSLPELFAIAFAFLFGGPSALLMFPLLVASSLAGFNWALLSWGLEITLLGRDPKAVQKEEEAAQSRAKVYAELHFGERDYASLSESERRFLECYYSH